MDFTEKEFKMYQSINFHSRYEKLSNAFQFEEELKYSKDAVIKLITDLGYKAKHVRQDNFFRVSDNEQGFTFYLNMCLKYSMTELIIGASNIKTDEYLTGGTFGGICKDIERMEGREEREGYIRCPKFRNYEDLRIILTEAFSIYEDFKRVVIKEYGELE